MKDSKGRRDKMKCLMRKEFLKFSTIFFLFLNGLASLRDSIALIKEIGDRVQHKSLKIEGVEKKTFCERSNVRSSVCFKLTRVQLLLSIKKIICSCPKKLR